IARHIQSSNNRLAGEDNSFTPEWIYTLYEELPDKINSDTPAWAIELLGSCRSKLLEGLARNQLNSSVSQFYLCTWGYANMLNWQWDAKKDSDAVEISNWSPESVLAVQTSVERYWFMSLHLSPESEPEYSDFQFPEMNYADIELLAELLMSKQALYQSFNFLLSQIVACLDKEIVTFRVKALRALSRLAAESPRLLNETRLQTAVIHRIRDSSPSVRDAAIEVIAKYLGGQDNISLKLYKIVSARIMDTAVNVRKRMVKLLRDLYFTCDDGFIKIDIAAKIILRIGDNEVTISDLAIKMAQEILFHPFRDIDMEEANSFGYAYGDSNKQRKTRIARLTDIIVNAMANMEMITATKRDTALVQIVQKTMKTTDEKQRIWYEKVFQWIVDALFDRLLPLDEVGERKRFLHCLETAYAFIKSSRYVLTIYREVLPRMRFLDPDFVKHIERTLLQMLTNGPLEMMDSVVGCICSFVNISGRYILLVKVLGSCIEKLTKEQACVEQSGTCLSNEKQIMKMMLICGLLCRYFDFDGKRKTEASQMDLLGDTDKQDITTTIFELLLFFAHLSENNMAQALQIRVVALQSLGHVYARNPTLMIDKRSTDLLDSTIVDSSMIMRIQLMKVFHDFLGTEEQRIEKQEEGKREKIESPQRDVETLLGNTSEFAELGVNGSIMQRYLGKILECSIDTHTELRDAAFEVITVVMQQGLAHPAFCMPAIVAAETSPDLMLRNNAYYLHKMAHTKYGSILYIRLADFVTTAYRYQCMISSEAVKGYGRMGGDAMLESLFTLAYGIMAQKRTVKLDFLLVLIKPFDCDLKDPETAKLEVAFLQFLADNLLTLQFTHSEEPLHIIHYINRIMTTLGSDLLSQVQNLREEGVLDDDFYGISGTGTMDLDYLITAISCTGLCILYHVRRMLKTIYHLSDK
ncbi:sister chromatid cohesion C-terminus-domain-containing protein, partial [Radiomyces spectabilis]|uniref:sister chromatid cohesion C-terminus-domain-containing protein n=1 Tax=Radiomyces spectabilis TaxID=64574 RepID=UPI00221E7E68